MILLTFFYYSFSLLWNHCRTLTNPVSVIKCLESIKEYGFVASQYPVIITIEDHLTTDLRAKFAEVSMGFPLATKIYLAKFASITIVFYFSIFNHDFIMSCRWQLKYLDKRFFTLRQIA